MNHTVKFSQVLFYRMTSREVLDFFKGRKLNDGLLKKLNVTLISVNGVLDYTEETQIAKLAVKELLIELKDAVYEAEDFLDEIAYEAMRVEMEAGRFRSSLLSSLSPFIKGRKEIGKKLELILAKLEYLVKQKDALGLRESVVVKPSAREIDTNSLVDESGGFSRDGDMEAILDLLLSIDAYGNNHCVILIVGMGGVGKTIIAQLIYNEYRVMLICAWSMSINNILLSYD